MEKSKVNDILQTVIYFGNLVRAMNPMEIYWGPRKAD